MVDKDYLALSRFSFDLNPKHRRGLGVSRGLRGWHRHKSCGVASVISGSGFAFEIWMELVRTAWLDQEEDEERSGI